MITEEQVRSQLGNALTDAYFPEFAERSQYRQGKVRDIYVLPNGQMVLITTDRQSAFDHVLGTIPLKGQVLNRMAQYWFEQTADIAPNQVLAVPHPNVMVARKLRMLPVEVVVRRFLTGSSDTAIWTHYSRGVRNYCGHVLQDGMVKNQPLPGYLITPTTKSEGHDELLSCDEVVERGLVDAKTWRQVRRVALELFARGCRMAEARGLLLVDTKYEMGLDEEGRVTLADEVHTPDSSRYWIATTYQERHNRGEEPESLDKEFLRLWLRDKGISDTNIPELDDDIRVQVAQRYLELYERVTGVTFELGDDDRPVRESIREAITPYFA